MSAKARPSRQEVFRPLTKYEIDQRIDALVQTLAVSPDEEQAEPVADLRPRWISAAELVRRVRPFIVLN
jgi:hypothetical protein